MELSESDVCKLAIMLANAEDKKVLLELLDEAQKTDRILQERVVKPLEGKSVTELAPQNERIQIMDSADGAKQKLKKFSEAIIRRQLDGKSISNSNKDENSGWTNGEGEEPEPF